MLSSRKTRHAVRALVVLGGSAAALVALGGIASAHVTITPSTAQQGSKAELWFIVPNEESAASTVELQVKVPVNPPIAQFLVKPVPGWKISVQMVKLARPVVAAGRSYSAVVSLVTWSGGKILPGHYQQFPVLLDPLPSGVGQIAFKAIQTYSNGDVVRWIDLPQPGQPPPAHPAPILTLTSVSDTTPVNAGTTDSAASPAAPADNTTAISLAAAGLLAGALGLAAGLSAWLRERQRRYS